MQTELNTISILGCLSWDTSRCRSCIALAENNLTMGFPYVSSHFRGIKAGKALISHGRDEIYKTLLTYSII
jgi:hypothetical protein